MEPSHHCFQRLVVSPSELEGQRLGPGSFNTFHLDVIPEPTRTLFFAGFQYDILYRIDRDPTNFFVCKACMRVETVRTVRCYRAL